MPCDLPQRFVDHWRSALSTHVVPSLKLSGFEKGSACSNLLFKLILHRCILLLRFETCGHDHGSTEKVTRRRRHSCAGGSRMSAVVSEELASNCHPSKFNLCLFQSAYYCSPCVSLP